jgi:hypothetical protein
MREIARSLGKHALLGLTLLIVSATSSSAAGQADAPSGLAGSWKLDGAKSDGLQGELNRSGSDAQRVPEQRGGGGGGGGGRGRSAAIELIRDLTAGDEQLMIAEKLATLTVTTSDGRVTTLAASNKPSPFSIGGRSLEHTVIRSGNQVIERLAMPEGWTVARTFTLPAPGQLEIRFEGRGGGSAKPVDLRRTYSRVRR